MSGCVWRCGAFGKRCCRLVLSCKKRGSCSGEPSRGRHRPVLAAGRDGIMIPMRNSGYQEASTATVSVYDRRRRRLGTIYLGQMPEAKQVTLTRALTALLRATLTGCPGPVPRLASLPAKGAAPDDYYRQGPQ